MTSLFDTRLAGIALSDAIPYLLLGLILILALIAHWMAVRILTRIVRRTQGMADDLVIARIAAPLRWIFVVVALSAGRRVIPIGDWADRLWTQLSGFILPALFGWGLIAMVGAFRDVVELRADISMADNLRARRHRTRVSILSRIAIFVILFFTLSAMLLSIPGVRNVGVTLMASAGIAGLVVGAAAQPALKNLIAGVQMAFTEPIRIDDVVIIAGEWGRIEEIRLTYVVVKIWDERRLIVPVSKFLEEPFQNWTRQTSQLLGSAFLYVDPTADVARIRARAAELAEANALWDKRFVNLQVTDIKPEVMELRVLVTASDASRAFDLRCDMREALIAFIRDEMPEALPRQRISGTGPDQSLAVTTG
ncbi:hypothetical protein CLG96_15195 [Sphingomonas oleivorans]|uniref:Mechanosensitive ion channel MscS domain-containing protein n=1 Tax=Sphingomonas oleivorans TaxID=1735121 RepID=A0A2T5FUY0_9SPHN|nr:mechanosensitive ion channel domain-containing protein [Sphingomonas oleivorans]PTQ08545.1 hypothetical protein CLG96_15195 [Sphingomonas oleivorans]